MSRDMILSTTVAPCANSAEAWATACSASAAAKVGTIGISIGIEQPLDLDRIEPVPAVGERGRPRSAGRLSVSGANSLGIAGGTCASASTTSRWRTRCMKPRTASSSVG